MDISTLLGVVLGSALVLWGIMSGGPLSSFWDAPSLFITFGGTIGAVLVQHSMDEILNLFRVLKVLFTEPRNSPLATIRVLVGMAEKARREGLLSLEEEAEAFDDPFLRKGVQLVVDGTDPDLVRNVLEIEISFVAERHRAGQEIFATMGAFAPAFGMIGTLIGLVQMLSHMDDPSMVGPGMATALLTTFYGAFAANLLFLPAAGKLRMRSDREILQKQMIVEGVLSIQAGENPRIVEEKLKSFLSPKQRTQGDRESRAEEETVSA